MILYMVAHIPSMRFYVGKTTKSLPARKKQHYNDAICRALTHFHKALMKYPKDEFQWVTLKKLSNKYDLNKSEIDFIKLLKSVGHTLFNMTDGGDGGSRPGEFNPNFGKKLDSVIKEKISKSLIQYYSENNGTFKNRNHTEKTKKLISDSKIGKPLINARGNRLSVSGSKNPSAKKIKCTTTGEIFAFAKAAAVKHNCDLSSIIKCCKGKVKTVKGNTYEYSY